MKTLRTAALRALAGAALALAFSAAASAAEIRVSMVNAGASGPMAFEPAFVKASPGDTVVFVPKEKGAHNSASILVPDGAKPWKGAPDQEVRATLDKEGVYLFACEPHKAMGMVGVVLVGKPTNLAAAKARAAEETAKFTMNKDRFDKALAQIK